MQHTLLTNEDEVRSGELFEVANVKPDGVGNVTKLRP
jgi:hypothetical protein